MILTSADCQANSSTSLTSKSYLIFPVCLFEFLDIHIKHTWEKPNLLTKLTIVLSPEVPLHLTQAKNLTWSYAPPQPTILMLPKPFQSVLQPSKSPSYQQPPLLLPIFTWVTNLIFPKCYHHYHLSLVFHEHCHLPHPIGGSLQVLH